MGDVFPWEFFLKVVDASVNVQRDAVAVEDFFGPSVTQQQGSSHVADSVNFDKVAEVPEMPFVVTAVVIPVVATTRSPGAGRGSAIGAVGSDSAGFSRSLLAGIEDFVVA
eukprot:CAMPEP_0194491902 /NCGR_PEP_ID=MMETSP0253-20130528/10647_1 /TAXON_ID=2966 /ORGANISM="Noctiluca scintillans" /LENGTH=109 /DNA_ID=CAMNT_0039332703 /DNA_START=233 /DNA_END=566 /DNA_ORIENTATION=-